MFFVTEKLQDIAEFTAASKNTRSRAKTVQKKSLKHAKRGKKLKRSKTAASASESQLETSAAGKPVSSSGEKKKDGVKKNQSGSSVLENGPLQSSSLKMKSPPILAPLKTKLPPVLAPKPKKRSKNKHYLCSQCGRELKSKSALEIHLRMHTDSRPFTCSTCGRGFRANGGLTRHQVLLMKTL